MFIVEFHAHVGHEDQQRVDLVRVAAPGIGDDVMHHAVHRQRIFPRECLVDAHRAAICIDEQIVRIGWPAQCHAIQRSVGFDRQRRIGRARARRNRARERSLVAEAAGSIDGAEQRHQNRQRAYRLETVGMRRQTAHGMKGHRIAGDAVVFLAPRVGPCDRQFDLLVACRDAHFIGEAADGLDRNAGDLARPFRGVIFYPLLQQLESGLDRRAVGQLEFAEQEWIGSLGSA